MNEDKMSGRKNINQTTNRIWAHAECYRKVVLKYCKTELSMISFVLLNSCGICRHDFFMGKKTIRKVCETIYSNSWSYQDPCLPCIASFFSKNVTPPFPMYPPGSMMKEFYTNIKTFFCSLEMKALFLNEIELLIRIFIKVNEKQDELKTSREIFPDVNNKLL